METINEFEIRRLGAKNKGLRHERTNQKRGEREQTFSKHWRKENVRNAHINQGCGILQNLFFENVHPLSCLTGTCITFISKRERFIVATVIQWLGTNCGWCFLEEVLKDCGYKIVKNDNLTPNK